MAYVNASAENNIRMSLFCEKLSLCFYPTRLQACVVDSAKEKCVRTAVNLLSKEKGEEMHLPSSHA